MHDIGYFRRGKEDVHASQLKWEAWEHEKKKEGWTGYAKLKKLMGSNWLDHSAPSSDAMDKFHSYRNIDEATIELVDHCTTRQRGIMRRVIMGWQMRRQLDGVIWWVNNMVAHEKLMRRVFDNKTLVGSTVMAWFYGPLTRPIARWLANTKAAKYNAEYAVKNKGKAAAMAAQAAQDFAAQEFTQNFVNAIDDDDDGALSLCELKSAELQTKGAENPLFAKAAIWLLNAGNWNFKKYSGGRNDGIINQPELIEAMRVFLQEHWKYEGTLW